MSWSTGKSSSETSPWSPAQDDLKNILGESKDLYENTSANTMDTGYMEEMKKHYENVASGGQDISTGDIMDRAKE